MRVLVTVCVLGWSAAGLHAAGEVTLAEPIRLQYAGVTVAVPEAFELRQPDYPNLVLHARKVVNDVPVIGLKLGAWRLGAADTRSDFIKQAHPARGRVFTQVKVLKERPIQLAGAEGVVQVMSYQYRGTDVTAIWMFVTRMASDGRYQMGYTMSVEAERARGKDTLPVLIAVAKSLRLSDPAHPRLEIAALGEAVASARFGYAIRPPKWWKVIERKTADPPSAQVMMFQMDYVADAQLPMASLIVTPETQTAGECVKRDLEGLKERMQKARGKLEVLSEEACRMAGRDGYGFVARHIPPEDASEGGPTTMARRTVCANGLSYSLGVMAERGDVPAVQAALAALAGTLKLSTPAGTTTVPATAPARPAAGSPAPAPAPSTRPALPAVLPPAATRPTGTDPTEKPPATAPRTGPGGLITPGYRE